MEDSKMLLFLTGLVFACATLSNAGCRFEKWEGHTLYGYNMEILNDLEQTKCAEACLQSTTFSCQSFDYSASTQTCFLSDKDRHTYPEAYGKHRSNDYYEKVCGDDVDEGETTSSETTSVPTGDCGSWREFGGSCYMVVFEDDKRWKKAQNDCISYGGHLASVNSEQEYSFVTNLLDEELEERGEGSSRLELFWIGGRKKFEDWVWEEGSSVVPMSFSAWHSGEPNNDRNREDVVSLVRFDGDSWGFNDGYKQDKLRYVCERKPETDNEGSDGSSEILSGDKAYDNKDWEEEDGISTSGEAPGGDGVEHVSIVPETKVLNSEPGAGLNVLTSHRIMRAGRLTRWEYIAARAGVVYLDIWRKGNDGRLQLVGYNRVVCKGPGYWEFAVPVEQQILVKVFDMVGVHYPKSAEASNQGVVYYEESRNPGSYGVVSTGLFDDTLKLGSTIPDKDMNWMHVKKNIAVGADIDYIKIDLELTTTLKM